MLNRAGSSSQVRGLSGIKTITLFKVMLWVPGNTKAKTLITKRQRGGRRQREGEERGRERETYIVGMVAGLLSCCLAGRAF